MLSIEVRLRGYTLIGILIAAAIFGVLLIGVAPQVLSTLASGRMTGYHTLVASAIPQYITTHPSLAARQVVAGPDGTSWDITSIGTNDGSTPTIVRIVLGKTYSKEQLADFCSEFSGSNYSVPNSATSGGQTRCAGALPSIAVRVPGAPSSGIDADYWIGAGQGPSSVTF